MSLGSRLSLNEFAAHSDGKATAKQEVTSPVDRTAYQTHLQPQKIDLKTINNLRDPFRNLLSLSWNNTRDPSPVTEIHTKDTP
jgi:hypothetical protein